MSDRFEETRGTWKKRIEEWQSSGKSIAQWCRDHQLDYKAFIYWKKRFSLPKFSFVELKEEKTSEVNLEYAGFHIYLSKDFDAATLTRVLRTLKSL